MKRWFSFLLAASLSISLFACGPADQENGVSTGNTSTVSERAPETPGANGETEPPAAEEAGGTNILVAYFSWADNAVLADDVDAVASPSVIPPGNVQQLAGWVQEETGGDLFAIRVADPYPSDWDACLERAN